MRREVVRVVTPGVMLDDEVLEPKTARYLRGKGFSDDVVAALVAAESGEELG